ncbi:MAG: cobyrinate a,c-diamide synthase [Anaerolineae bacterium]
MPLVEAQVQQRIDDPRALPESSARLVISAPGGRCGKTIVSLGLCAAFRERELRVQPFKRGPDYIDPSWLAAAAGRPCRNLDLFMMDAESILDIFQQGRSGAQLSIIEGAMGLYDGLDLAGSTSTARLARLLAAPVVLVVNTTRISRSVAALVQGFQNFEPETNLVGVILNRVARPRHETKLRAALEHYCHIKVVGALPADPALTIPQRHLGLVPRPEHPETGAVIAAARRLVEAHVDLEGVLALARAAPALPPCRPASLAVTQTARIGVAVDRAFSFYYPANLEALETAGAQLCPFDTLAEPNLPDVDALYLGGGFPEVFLEALEANHRLRNAIREAIEEGMPVYAECGGLMYLARSIAWNGRRAEMVAALPCDIELTARPRAHGYVTLRVEKDNAWFRSGTEFRGHEFHHSQITNLGDVRLAYAISRGHGVDGERDGILYKNVLAAYTHLHALGAPGWAERLVEMARGYRQARAAA